MQIKFSHVNHTYSKKTPFEYNALKDINLELEGHFFTSLIGQTGSGKSTLVQHINGLLLPTSGTVNLDNYQILTKGKKACFIDLSSTKKRMFRKNKQYDVKLLRKKAGLVFQFPEYQLFEPTIIQDVMYGPLNYKVSQEDAKKQAEEALKMVGLDSSFYDKSPFELSGGQKRRVAIAGILALNPDVLILDEPTAGLDPLGEKQMMELFNDIYNQGKNIILVTHNMDIVLKYVKNCIVMDKGQIIFNGKPLDLFQNNNILQTSAIRPPEVFNVANKLIENGLALDLKNIKDVESLAIEIERVIHD